MKFKGFLLLAGALFSIFLYSCTKVNQSTNLGDGLIPAVDNVTTFETSFDVTAGYFPFDDSTKNIITENMALGKITDPVFGTTLANIYFNLSLGSPSSYGSYPFGPIVDSIKSIDSVVLSLGYRGTYGDTLNTDLGVEVYEIAQANGFVDTAIYRYNHADFTTTGSVLGNKTFSIKNFKDSVSVIRKGDTTKVANVLRIPLNNSIATKLMSYKAANAGDGYYSDSSFRQLFRGLAVKTVNMAGANGGLAYFNLSDAANSKLVVYYKVGRSGGIDSAASVSFVHANYSQANSIQRTPGGSYAASLSQSNPQGLYIQSSPSGSYVSIKIRGLDTLPNKVIHRAELIAYKIPSTSPSSDLIFGVPQRLVLDHKGGANGVDTVFGFQNDLAVQSDGTLSYASFGGTLGSDNTYRFNLTRYVQGIVTRKDRNDSLRLFAPLRTVQYYKGLSQPYLSVNGLSTIAYGRVVLAGGNYIDPSMRLRLRVIYSNL